MIKPINALALVTRGLSWRFTVDRSFSIGSEMTSIFVQKLNVLNGNTEWVVQDENYDFHQEIARSAFADMLHDTDRNQKYYTALRKAIEFRHSKGEKANVLDIGTGTGLLSMMAAVCNADSIVACEAFSPIADVAKKVISLNGFSNKIKVVNKRSTEMLVGPGKDMEFRANILVTEVFDTELIGEGAIATFNHAKEQLLEEDAIVVPHLGRVYCCVVESNWLRSHNALKPNWKVKDGALISIPDAVSACPGSPSLHDLQVSELPPNSFRVLSDVIQVFKFDFEKGEILKKDNSVIEMVAKADGTAHCVIMWWDLIMDMEGEVIISCAPEWKPDGNQAWRDHWMQAVYHLEPVQLREGEVYSLVSSHDEFSLWFNVAKDMKEIKEGGLCYCGLHATWSRSRLAATELYWEHQIDRLTNILTDNRDGNLLFLGDSSLLPLAAGYLTSHMVYCVEPSATAFKVMKSLIRYNHLQNKVILLPSYDASLIKHEISLVYSEPYFRSCLYPWEGLRYWYLMRQLCPNAKPSPTRMSLLALPMSFVNLHKIRLPLSTVETFNMAPFDSLIKESSDLCDSNMEVQPLWEYPGTALGHPQELISFQLDQEIPNKPIYANGELRILKGGNYNGVAVWCEWFDGDTLVSSSGPTRIVTVGSPPSWEPTVKQAVYISSQPSSVVPNSSVSFSLSFQPDRASFSFNFQNRDSAAG